MKHLGLALLFGILGIGYGSAAEPIKIGAIIAQTGVAVETKFASLTGFQLAVETVNKNGGISGRPLTLLVFDNASSPIGSKVAADKAVAAGVVGIVGSQWSSHSLAVAKVAQAHGIPMVSNISTHPDVTQVGNYIFRVCYTDPFQGNILARFAREDLKAGTAIIMTDIVSNYSIGLSETFERAFAQAGGKILAQIKYKQKEENFQSHLTEIQKATPDAVFLSGHSESGFIIRQALELNLKTTFLGGDGWDDTVFFQNGGNLAKEAYFTTHWSKEVDNNASRDFLQKYPDYGDAALVLAYDAAMLLADAIQRAGAIDPAKIRDALAETRNYPGVTGTISMNSDGDPIKNAVIMMTNNGNPSFLKSVSP